MKTKSKLVLGLSILGAATMAVGATSTFAWYQLTFSTVNMAQVSVTMQDNTPSTAGTATLTASYWLNNNTTPVASAGSNKFYIAEPATNSNNTKFINYVKFGEQKVPSGVEGIVAVEVALNFTNVDGRDNNSYTLKITPTYEGENKGTVKYCVGADRATAIAATPVEGDAEMVYEKSIPGGTAATWVVIAFVDGATEDVFTAGSFVLDASFGL